MSGAYYNENDRFACAWLRELIKKNLIADGDVDERSILEVQANEIRKYTQHHFFAGIGVWSYALRAAGWPDDFPVVTGSCPCQSFSASGKRQGFSDQRHLWPAWFRLIRELQPDALFGEQVASKDGLAWFDVVSSDLEKEGYTVGACDLPACGIGAPHIRNRLYFVAHTDEGRSAIKRTPWIHEGRERRNDTFGRSANEPVAHAASARRNKAERTSRGDGLPLFPAQPEQRSGTFSLADTECDGGRTDESRRRSQGREVDGRISEACGMVDTGSEDSEIGSGYESKLPAEERRRRSGDASITHELGHAESGGCGERRREKVPGNIGHTHQSNAIDAVGDTGASRLQDTECQELSGAQRNEEGRAITESSRAPTNGFWQNAVWLYCKDDKWRPTEPSIFPLVNGAPGRVGRLRGYGNALVAPVAQAFIESFLEVIGDK
jgi:DNA (cytosine-5)-methyltransferase 1